jgi:hypothetical protein
LSSATRLFLTYLGKSFEEKHTSCDIIEVYREGEQRMGNTTKELKELLKNSKLTVWGWKNGKPVKVTTKRKLLSNSGKLI